MQPIEHLTQNAQNYQNQKRPISDPFFLRQQQQQQSDTFENVQGEDDETFENDGESVYMIDGVVMRMIHIEGEEQQYLMDPQGRIFDMQANFIGTANTQGLEELEQL